MRIRPLLIGTALVSSILGAIVAYLVLTVPNDVQAAALMRQARKQIAAGQNETARQALTRIIQQYPRTDAAAAATVALASIEAQEREELVKSVDLLRQTNVAQQKQIADLTQKVDTIASTPPPAPITVTAPAKPTKKPSRRAHRTRRRRHR